MTIRNLNTQAISATGQAFVVDSISHGAATGVVPYSKIMDGAASGTAVARVTALGLAVNPAPVAISGTAMVSVMNQIDASVHGFVTAHIANQVDVSAHGFVSAHITNQITALITGTALVSVMNQLDASVHGLVSAHITNTPNVIASHETGTIYNGSTAITPKFANISMATAGAQTIIAAVAAKRLRVISMFAVAKTAVGLFVADGGGGNNLAGDSTNKITLAANGGFVLPYNPAGWFQTSASSAFQITPDVASPIAGSVTYLEV